MDKFSELSSNARKAANTFYNWSQLANCTSERVSCLTVEQLKETSELFSTLLAELEAKDKRIAELEFANQSQDDHINQQQDRIDSLEKTNTGLGQRLGAAEKRLATPVDINLPERRDDSYDWDGASPSEAFNTCRSICGLMFRQQLRAGGVKVEGDE
ncbi:Uncharacterised protein [Klebsiella oxytoca]|nr:Uncharacterised protein [Klebsiella oxytoca]